MSWDLSLNTRCADLRVFLKPVAVSDGYVDLNLTPHVNSL